MIPADAILHTPWKSPKRAYAFFANIPWSHGSRNEAINTPTITINRIQISPTSTLPTYSPTPLMPGRDMKGVCHMSDCLTLWRTVMEMPPASVGFVESQFPASPPAR